MLKIAYIFPRRRTYPTATMRQPLLILLLTAAALAAHAGDMKTYTFDCEAWS